MREVIYWISVALMLFATGMNLYAWFRSTRCRKLYQAAYKEVEIMRDRYRERLERLGCVEETE